MKMERWALVGGRGARATSCRPKGITPARALMGLLYGAHDLRMKNHLHSMLLQGAPLHLFWTVRQFQVLCVAHLCEVLERPQLIDL